MRNGNRGNAIITREFVLGSAGHTQSILSAPGNAKSKLFTNTMTPASPDEWLAGAQPHDTPMSA